MKKIIYLLTATALLALGSTSCREDKKENPTSPNGVIEKSLDLKIPSGFAFNTDKEVTFNLAVNSNLFQNYKFRVEVYDQFPHAAASPVAVSFLANGESNASLGKVRTAASQVYIVTTYPTGTKNIETLPLNSNTLSYTFSTAGRSERKTQINASGCTGCTQTLNNQSNYNGNFNGNAVVCITGSFSGGINLGGNAQIRVCSGSNVNFSYLNTNGNSSVEINSGATVVISNFGQNGNSTNFNNFSQNLSFNNGFGANGTIYNQGVITINGEMSLNGNSNLVNYGSITTAQSINFNSTAVNYGSMASGNDINFNNGATVTNYCSMTANNTASYNITLNNHGFISSNNANFNSGGNIIFHNSAMILVNNAGWINSDFIGLGSTSTLKINNVFQTNAGASFSGNLEICANSTGNQNGTITLPAAIACSNYIPESGCNPVGTGTPPAIADTDGDGVADDQDEYPNDANRAFNVYYPSQNGFATIAFEDLWPAYGDFDFNDLVVDYRWKAVTNASNNAVDLELTYKVEAIGASFNNSFGVAFDAASGVVASVSGQVLNNFTSNGANGTESGQSNAVVIVFDKAFDVLPNPGSPFVNTVPGQPFVAPQERIMEISLGTPTSIGALGGFPFNLFTVVNQDRGKEIHLAGGAPTALANNALFGSINDATGEAGALNYTSKEGLPWAINLTDGFNYPIEKEDIVNVYLQFADWAQSGGSQYPLWYINNASNVVTAKVY